MSNRTDMIRSHVIISGTGRAGTTFLVQLLTHLGFDTGYEANKKIELFPIGRAGLEFPIKREGPGKFIFDSNTPYIIKTPFLCNIVETTLGSSVRIEHAIIPVRRFDAAAASRALVQEQATGSVDGRRRVPGGLWDTDKAGDQADVLRLKFARLIEVLTRFDIPITFLWYPRLIRDPDYLYAKLNFLLGKIEPASFRTAFNKIVRPEWVHQFTADDQ